MSNEALDKVLANLVIPVVVIHDAATTPAVTDGLVDGGLPVAARDSQTIANLSREAARSAHSILEEQS